MASCRRGPRRGQVNLALTTPFDTVPTKLDVGPPLIVVLAFTSHAWLAAGHEGHEAQPWPHGQLKWAAAAG